MLGCAFVISKWCCWAGSWMYRSKIEEKSGDINVGVLGPSRSCGLGWHHLREKHNLRSGALLGTKLWGTPTLRGIERAGREGTPENCIKEEGPERQDGNQKRMVLKKPREEGVLERRAWIALAKLLKISSKRRTTILKTHKRIQWHGSHWQPQQEMRVWTGRGQRPNWSCWEMPSPNRGIRASWTRMQALKTDCQSWCSGSSTQLGDLTYVTYFLLGSIFSPAKGES